MMASSTGFFDSLNPWSWGAKRRASGTDDSFSDAVKLYPDLWGELFMGSNVICCPVSGSLVDAITKDLLMSHILVPQRIGGEFKTILGEHVIMSGSQLLCGAGFLEQREVNVISVSEITDSNGRIATLFRLNRPLVGGIVAPDDSEEITLQVMFKYMAVLRSFPETESPFIVLDDYIKEINFVGSKSIDGFSRILPSLAVSLQLQWERAAEKLCRINALVLALGGGFDSTKRMIGQILESYLMHAVSGTVYPWVCSSMAVQDKLLHEYLETLQHYTQSDLGIPPALQCCQIEAVKELNTLRYAETPVDKLLVLKRTVKLIRTRVDKNVKSKFPEDDVELATDDIVLLIIWCLLQLHLAPSLSSIEPIGRDDRNSGRENQRSFFLSDLEFMSKYHFNGSSKSELGFTLCHFQVSVDWFTKRAQAFSKRKKIKSIRGPGVVNLSTVMKGLKMDVSDPPASSASSAVAKIGKVTDRVNIIEKKESMRTGDRYNPGSPVSHPGSHPNSPIIMKPIESIIRKPRIIVERKAELVKEKEKDLGNGIGIATGIGKKVVEKNRDTTSEKKMNIFEVDDVQDSLENGSDISEEKIKKKNDDKENENENENENGKVVKEEENETIEMQKLGLEYLHGLCVTATEMNLHWITMINKNQIAVRQRAAGSTEYKMPYSFTAFSSPSASTSSMKSVIDDENLKAANEANSNLNLNLNFAFTNTPTTGRSPKNNEKKGKILLFIGDDHTHYPDILKKRNTVLSELTNKPGGIVCVAGSTGAFAAVSADGRIFTWGMPDSGRLGRGASAEFDAFTPTLHPTSVDGGGLYGCKVIQVACGKNHMAVITDTGELFTWGDNRCSQLGLTSTITSTSSESSSAMVLHSSTSQPPPVPVPVPVPISVDTSSILSYSFYGRATPSVNTATVTTPSPTIPIPPPITIPPIASTSQKTQYLSTYSSYNTNNSSEKYLPKITYSTPLSSKMSLELETISSCSPILIKHLRDKKLISIVCGAYHTLCLSDEGDLYSWGRCSNGRLGQHPDSLLTSDNLIGSVDIVNAPYNWVAQEFELFHASSNSASLSSSASSSSSSSSSSSTSPKRKPPVGLIRADSIDNKNVKVLPPPSSDDYFSFASIYAAAVPKSEITSDPKGDGPSVISNYYGQGTVSSDSETDDKGIITDGIPSQANTLLSPTKLIDTSHRLTNGLTPIGTPSLPRSLMFPNKVTCISAGYAHSLAVTACGAVFTWGCGTHGRLGHGSHCDEHYPRQVQVLTMSGIAVTSVSAGAAHSVFLSNSGLLFGCGLNSRGQVGCVTRQSEKEGDGDGLFKGPKKDKHDKDSILCPQPIDVSTEKFTGYSSRGILSECLKGKDRDREKERERGRLNKNGREIEKDCDGDRSKVKENKGKGDLRLISMTVASVSCGDLHTAVITHTGRLLIWGACSVTSSTSSHPNSMSHPSVSVIPSNPTRLHTNNDNDDNNHSNDNNNNINDNNNGNCSSKGNITGKLTRPLSPRMNGSPLQTRKNTTGTNATGSHPSRHSPSFLDKYDVTSGLGGVPLQISCGGNLTFVVI